jgi:regulatory protein YycH of two-component signal transduction system YycFG
VKENIKSLILLLLVCSSLLFTYQLWYGQQPAEVIADEDIYERIIVEQPRPPGQIIFPEMIALSVESGYYVYREGELAYYRLWETLLALVGAAAGGEIDSGGMAAENGFPDGEPVILSCYFNPLLPVGNDHFVLSDLPESDISRLDLTTASGVFWIRLIGPDNEPKFSAGLSAEQSALLSNMIAAYSEEDRVYYRIISNEAISTAVNVDLAINSPIFLPQEEILMARLPVSPELLDREQILKTFFVDYSLARTIEEKDGAVIYTDGERGLRLTTKGFEFSYPRLEEGEANQTMIETLQNSGTLISYHGGWPAGLRLENLTQTRRGRSASYSAQWRMYYQGYPIYAGKPTRAIFNDRGLIHFSRSVYNIQAAEPEQLELRPVAEWQAALRTAIDLYRQENGEEQSALKLGAFNLGYAIVAGVNEVVAEPVWHLQLNERRILLKADSLQYYKPEELQ